MVINNRSIDAIIPMHRSSLVGDISETKGAFKDLVAFFARFSEIFEAIFQKTNKLNCTNISVVLPPADLSLRFRDKVKKTPSSCAFLLHLFRNVGAISKEE